MGGTANHLRIETGLTDGQVLDLPKVVRRAIAGAERLIVEPAYAIDVVAETARLIGMSVNRNYGPLGLNEIALTSDLVVTAFGHTKVWDWKSRKRVTDASDNLQIRAECLAVLKCNNLPSVTGAIGYLDNSESDEAPFSVFDAAATFEDLRSILAEIRKKEPRLHSGPWCEYCPALVSCPSHNRLALSMLGEATDIEGKVAFMTPEQVGVAWEKLAHMKTLVERIGDSLKLRAKREIIPLYGGKKVLALSERSRTNFRAKEAKAWIAEHGGDPADFEGTTYYTCVTEQKAKER